MWILGKAVFGSREFAGSLFNDAIRTRTYAYPARSYFNRFLSWIMRLCTQLAAVTTTTCVAAASGRTRTANDSDRRHRRYSPTRAHATEFHLTDDDECVEKIIEAVNGKGNVPRDFSLSTSPPARL